MSIDVVLGLHVSKTTCTIVQSVQSKPGIAVLFTAFTVNKIMNIAHHW